MFLYDSEDFFVRLLKFLQIKEVGPNFWGKPILQKVWIIWSSLLYFNFQSSKYRISSSFISFQCILLDSGVLFSQSWNIYKLKRGHLISWGNQFSVCVIRYQFSKWPKPWRHKIRWNLARCFISQTWVTPENFKLLSCIL